MTLVTDFPLWEDCPFRNLLPKQVEIRRGLDDGKDTVAFWDPVLQRHVDVAYERLFWWSSAEWLKAVLIRLGNGVNPYASQQGQDPEVKENGSEIG